MPEFMVPAETIEEMEVASGANYRSQQGEWLELPGDLGTTGAYGLGYTEATEAEAIGWGRELGKLRDGSNHRWVPWTFRLHNLTHYRISLATYLAAGFVFHEGDLRNYIQWMEFDNLHWQLTHFYDEWAKDHGVYYAGRGKDKPEYEEAHRRSTAIHQARRWAEKFYLRGQSSGPKFIRGKLPPGWRIADGEHHYGYWTVIQDSDGEERGTIFFKAFETCHMRLHAATWDEALGRNVDHVW